MPNFLVKFDTGKEERVENVVDGTAAKTEARKRSGLVKDERAAGSQKDTIAKIVSVEQLDDDADDQSGSRRRRGRANDEGGQ